MNYRSVNSLCRFSCRFVNDFHRMVIVIKKCIINRITLAALKKAAGFMYHFITIVLSGIMACSKDNSSVCSKRRHCNTCCRGWSYADSNRYTACSPDSSACCFHETFTGRARITANDNLSTTSLFRLNKCDFCNKIFINCFSNNSTNS